MPAIGIDLGTTNSCVAVKFDDDIQVLTNTVGEKLTPSYVGFFESEVLIGHSAKNQSHLHPHNTVFDVKRLIGRPFDDPQLTEDRKNWPFEVIDVNGQPRISVEVNNRQKHLTPVEISSYILKYLKQVAESHFQEAITDAVITVPAYFNQSQRQATIDAGRIAGLNVLEVINEPTAAGITYVTQEGLAGDHKTFLVYDLGGGTFDVSLMQSDGHEFRVLSTDGDTHLGGEDFDHRLVSYFVDEIMNEYKVDVKEDKVVIHRLREASEQAKRTLTCSISANIELDCLFKNQSFKATINRAVFEKINSDLFQTTIKVIEKALQAAGKTKQDVDEVLLVGGSTRVPVIAEIIKKFFVDKPIRRTVNPDECVAVGAAIRAYDLVACGSDVVPVACVKDIIPLPLGIEIISGMMKVMVPKNSVIPFAHTEEFATSKDNQTAVRITIFEGEGKMVNENRKLGNFVLTDLTPAPKGVMRITVTFDIDQSGVLHVSAKETSKGMENSIRIHHDMQRLTDAQIEELIQNTSSLVFTDLQQ
ncbi:heat shock 70kDa protein 1/2/6/8 [Paragonimus westermani]|uniref:Heat shock 70kDa protein 1/2/6/8 n=1 Tax=Paragonimus westermani TaxID=34504 RepID=A0A5J4NWM0_9TREM|nr:heat shock 70kDa protein 1/2/6/8 [Paragonimus westermani]